MTSFDTTIFLVDKEYKASIYGHHSPFERGTWESPEIKASFSVEKILIIPNEIVGEIDLMAYEYNWLVNTSMLEEIEKDFFIILKGEDYD